MRRFAVLLIPIALVFAACGNDDDDTADALSTVCDEQEQVTEDLAELLALDPTVNTTSDYQSALEDLDQSVDNLVSARGDFVEQDVDNVQSAYDDARAGLDDLDDVPLAEADQQVAAELATQLAELQELYLTAYANSSCAPSSEDG